MAAGDIGSRDGTVYCLYTTDGDVKWRSEAIGDYVSSSPAYNDQRIYIGATGGFFGDSGVYCLSASDGAILWQYTY